MEWGARGENITRSPNTGQSVQDRQYNGVYL